MPIVHMLSNELNEYQKEWPEGAYCLLGNYYGCKDDGTPHVITLYETHHGRCLFERERNMHDDSDFFMTVWEDGAPRELLFATTRGWSYPCYASHVDATPEVQAAYAAWKLEDDRRRSILYRWRKRKQEIELAADLGVSRAHVRRLLAAFGGETNDFLAIARLLKTKKFKSTFRQSLRDQVVTWMNDPNPKYARPLSANQLGCLLNAASYWRRRY